MSEVDFWQISKEFAQIPPFDLGPAAYKGDFFPESLQKEEDSPCNPCMDKLLFGAWMYRPEDKESDTFTFVNRLGREYDDEEENVFSIEFAISHYGAHKHTISFPKGVTEQAAIGAAIGAAEEWLSQPLDEKFWEKIRENSQRKYSWDIAREKFKHRGAALTGTKNLTDSDNVLGVLTLLCSYW